MKRFSFYPAIVLAAMLTASSCTTMKKYDDLNARKLKLETEKADCDKKLQAEIAQRKKLQEEVTKLTDSNRLLKQDTAQTGMILRKTKSLYNDLNSTYDKLVANHNKLMANSATESSKLSSELLAREAQLKKREEELKKLDENYKQTKGRVEELSGTLKTKEQRLMELEKALAEKDAAVTNLRNKVQGALLGFKDKDLTIDIRNGKVYVSLAEQLLFKSGSTKVDPKGQDALQKLAKVLKEQEDVNVVVEGHTDDVPIARGTAGMQDNWDLSVLRATEITRILQNNGVPGARITPSGRGENVPLDAAKTSEARQKNRRTEIILTPKLDELFQILEKN